MTFDRLAPLLLALLGGPLAGAALPEPADYGYRFPLTQAQAADFYQVELTPEVYRSVADPLLRDAGVYNAAGRPVPRRFSHPDEARGPELRTALGLAPLYGEADLRSDPSHLRLRLDAAGTRLELGTDYGGRPGARGQVVAYLIDARGLQVPPEQLEFDWQQRSPGLMAEATVQHSTDLRHWRTIGSGTLVDIAHAQTRIEQRRIELSAAPTDFLRILWRGMPEGWRLRSVTGIHSGSATAPRDWLTLTALNADGDGGTFRYDAGGFPPVDRIALLLPDGNAVVRASVSYRGDDDSPWRPVHTGVFYALSSQGRSLRAPPATIAPSRGAQWQVRIESGMASGSVQLQLGWRPDRLTFLAQGEGPFELVCGRARDRVEDFPQQSLLGDAAIFAVLEQSGQAGQATLGARQEMAGASALTPAGMSWRTLLLWAGLAAAVSLAGWMVYSLLRELKDA